MQGRIRRDGASWQADDVDARIGENRLTINGELESGSNVESRIALQADGPDISILQDFTDLEGIPARPFDIDVTVRSHPDGVLIEEGTGIFGENRIDARGTVALKSGLDGTTGSIRLSGPDFHNVALVSGVPYLPAGPYDIAGDVALAGNIVHLQGVAANVGDLQGQASGTVAISGDDPGRFELDVMLAGPDIAALPEVEGLEHLAGDPFRVAGRLSRTGELLTATDLTVSVGDLNATLNGALVGAAKHVRMSIKAASENSLMIRKIARLKYLPEGPVVIDGHVEMSAAGVMFADTVLSVGDYRVAADGTMSLQPRSNASDLVFSIAGPSLHEAGLVGGFAALPEKGFSVSGDFVGTPTGFEMRNFIARVGDSNLNGEFDVDLAGKPRIRGTLASTRLDLTDQVGRGEASQEQAQPEKPGETADDVGGERLFSGKRLDTSWLQKADIDVRLQIDELIGNRLHVTDVVVGLELLDGALGVAPFFLREDDGTIEATFSLVPRDSDYELQTSVKIESVHIGMLAPGIKDTASLPPTTGNMQFSGSGNSIRSIMASLNGQLSVRQDAGKVQELFGMGIFRDVLLQVLRTLNPLSRARDYQLLECGIYEISVKDGLAEIDNFIIQTDSMTTVARGEINLRNERLEIAFRAKPREGIGISLGTVANQLLEVRGTLASPRIRLDAGRTAATTGAAVATGGLSLLARGLWDRLSAEGDVCKKDPKRK